MRIINVTPSQQVRSNRPVCTNVKDFGARGDGITNDAPAIQKAIDAAGAGCTVLFPSGTYLVRDQQLVINKTLTIFLDENVTIQVAETVYQGNLFSVSGASTSFTIEGVGQSSIIRTVFSGGGSLATVAGSFKDFTLRNLRWESARYGISVVLTGLLVVENVVGSLFLSELDLNRNISRAARATAATVKNTSGVPCVLNAQTIFVDQLSSSFLEVLNADSCRLQNSSPGYLQIEDSASVEVVSCNMSNNGFEVVRIWNGAVSGLAKVSFIGGSIQNASTNNLNRALYCENTMAGSTLEVLLSNLVIAGATSYSVPAVRVGGGATTVVSASNISLSNWPKLTDSGVSGRQETKNVLAERFFGVGPALAASDVSLSAGWGTGPSVSVSGTDMRGEVTVTAGTSPAANPTITITFKGGAFPTAPFALVKRKDTNSPAAEPKWTTSTTQLVITFPDTPVAGTAYTFAWHVIG